MKPQILCTRMLYRLLSPAFLLLVALIIPACSTQLESWDSGKDQILVFSKTEGYRHKSIKAGKEALVELGAEHRFQVVLSEDSELFSEQNLQQYSAVVFLNTTGNVLNQVQQNAFENYIRSGGGFVGVHSATDTEYDWEWYGGLVGAQFESHPEVQTASLTIVNQQHPATEVLPTHWEKEDEWYNFKAINPDINVLINIDESSYEGGKNGTEHPVAWYHDYDGGRAFYTAMGHTASTYKDPLFLAHLLGGLAYAAGDPAIAGKMPEEVKFVREVLDFNLDEPMELDELPGEGILFVERRGALKLYDLEQQTTRVIAQIDVFYGNEDGLIGLAVDPNYHENHWIYLFYSAPGEESKQYISRFELTDGELDHSSEKRLLTIPTDRKCCHSGGSLEFGPKGNLFIAIGDNTNPFESSGFAPIDEREGRAFWDAQRSAANTMDLRGKVLRIKPEADGSYSIPDGNLFPQGTPNTRSEIYVMGSRNPFRPSIDSATGDLFWGDVGPDAGRANPERGPHGMGEFNRAESAGFWGWPYTRGDNQPYVDYDFATEISGEPFDPENIVNDSPNSTGLRELPPVKESFAWYSYGKTDQFPWLGSGGVNPMAGPVFHRADFEPEIETFPAYFENSLFLYEWMRDWIYVVSFDNSGKKLKRAEPFMPQSEFSHPMDMIFGADGSMYLLEYGQKWNSRNMDARLNRIAYRSDNTVLSVLPGQVMAQETTDVPEGKKLIDESDCSACHGVEQMVNGPSYRQISERYDNSDMDYLVNKVIEGGSGVWGERHMSPHPQLEESTVKEMVAYILLLNPDRAPKKSSQLGHQPGK